MTNHLITIKKGLKVIPVAIGFLLCSLCSRGQTQVTAPLTGTPAAGEYYSYGSITLSPNFSFTASAGSSLHLYTVSPDCQPLNTVASASQNYILTSTPQIPGYVPGGSYSSCQLMQTVQYFDGLGRPLQTVQVKGSPAGMDVVQPVAYDPYGRETVKYLPYTATTNNGSYKADALTAGAGQGKFYSTPPVGVSANADPYAQTVFEPSPLNRPVEQGAPGVPWQPGSGHTIRTAYGTNATGEVMLWTVNSAGNGAAGGTTFYAAGQLYATTSTDENGHNTIEYKDKEGRVVCKKAQLGTSPVSYLATYYVYNDLDNLCYVIPPLPAGTAYPASFLETDAVFTSFIYGYHYDGRNRLIEKKIPGKGWEFMVYNQLDQVIFSQDANQRALTPQQWTYTQYDGQGRVVITGLWSSTGASGSNGDTNQASPSRTLEQWLVTWANAQTILWLSRDNTTATGYSAIDPQGTVLTISYYDDYTFPNNPYTAFTSSQTPPRGLLTATKTAVLNANGSVGPMLWNVHEYDGLGRETLTIRQHYQGGAASYNTGNYDITTATYNFDNQLAHTTRAHILAGSTAPDIGIGTSYFYDHMGRQTQVWKSIWDEHLTMPGGMLLSQSDYNEIGQLQAKHLHSMNNGASFLQNISYTYNERGWLKGSSAPLFAMQLNYNDGSTPQWNGNITNQYWGIPGNLNKSYTYSYDPLNRLTAGVSNEGYTENNIVYDNLGNIKNLTRQGTAYTYNYTTGNQLSSVTGLTGSYLYDGNGNVISDGRTGKSISYNFLNLPGTETKAGTATLSYTYDAAGNKLNKNNGTTSTDYIEGIQYNNGVVSFVQTEEGRAILSGTTYVYEYDLGDHLGNTRVTFNTQSGGAQLVQQDDYMPFGKEISRSVNGTKNEYLYNKKELQEELGQYDYGARFYDPVIARWTTIDPLAETDRRWTPYGYGFDNPIRFEDPDGMWPDGGCCGVVGAFVGGLVQSGVSTVTGVYGVVRHPINTAKALGNVVAHPINTAKAIGKAVSNGYDDFKNGDANTKANIAGNVIGDVAQAFIGTEEVKAATETVKAAEVAGDVGKVSEAADVAKSSEYIDISGKNSVRNVQTDVTPGEFGSNLEQSGFKKAGTTDGKATNYTKGDAKYSVHESPQTSRGTAGASAEYSNGTKKPTLKIRLGGGSN